MPFIDSLLPPISRDVSLILTVILFPSILALVGALLDLYLRLRLTPAATLRVLERRWVVAVLILLAVIGILIFGGEAYFRTYYPSGD